jgi:hypothetical protein
MTGGWPLRILIRVALRKLLPKPLPAYGSRFKNDESGNQKISANDP